MITVTISINGEPIYARTAVRQQQICGDARARYTLDTGEWVFHDPKDGAVALAKLMLDTIKEPKSVRALKEPTP